MDTISFAVGVSCSSLYQGAFTMTGVVELKVKCDIAPVIGFVSMLQSAQSLNTVKQRKHQ